MACGREFYANLLIENSGFRLILGMDRLSTFHAIIDCQRRLRNDPEFEFIRGNKSLEPAEYKAKTTALLSWKS